MTTYSAQGTTVDRAFVMADPSMDKQEFYVAASRSRGETWLYATPEIQVHREEIAPESPYLRKGIPHIAEAAERDRAQLAAHDIAQLEALPTDELAQRRSELLLSAADEQRGEDRRDQLQREIAEIAEQLRQLAAERGAIEALHPSERGPELGFLGAKERSHREALEARQVEAASFRPSDTMPGLSWRQLRACLRIGGSWQLPPPASPRLRTSGLSWVSGLAIRRKARRGIAASRRLSATARRTASRTTAGRSAGSRREARSAPAASRPCGSSVRLSAQWAGTSRPLGAGTLAGHSGSGDRHS